MKFLKNKYLLITIISIASLTATASAGWSVYYLRKPVQLRYSLWKVKVDAPITIQFSQPIQSQLSYLKFTAKLYIPILQSP